MSSLYVQQQSTWEERNSNSTVATQQQQQPQHPHHQRIVTNRSRLALRYHAQEETTNSTTTTGHRRSRKAPLNHHRHHHDEPPADEPPSLRKCSPARPTAPPQQTPPHTKRNSPERLGSNHKKDPTRGGSVSIRLPNYYQTTYQAQEHSSSRIAEEDSTIEKNQTAPILPSQTTCSQSTESPQQCHHHNNNNHSNDNDNNNNTMMVSSPPLTSPLSSFEPQQPQHYSLRRQTVVHHPWRMDASWRNSSSSQTQAARQRRKLRYKKTVAPWRGGGREKARPTLTSLPEERPEEAEESASLLSDEQSLGAVDEREALVEQDTDIVEPPPQQQESSATKQLQDEEQEQGPPKDDALIQDLKNRLSRVYVGDHAVVEAYGQGLGRRPSKKVVDHEQVALKQRLVEALQARLEHLYTGHIATSTTQESVEEHEEEPLVSEHMLEKADPDNENDNDMDKEKEESGDEDDNSQLSLDETVVSIQSMIVAKALSCSPSNPEDVVSAFNYQDDEEEDEDDDGDSYTEYTVETAALERSSRQPSAPQPWHSQFVVGSNTQSGMEKDDDDDEWTECTIETRSRWEEVTVHSDTRSQAIANLKKSMPVARPPLSKRVGMDPPTSEPKAHSATDILGPSPVSVTKLLVEDPNHRSSNNKNGNSKYAETPLPPVVDLTQVAASWDDNEDNETQWEEYTVYSEFPTANASSAPQQQQQQQIPKSEQSVTVESLFNPLLIDSPSKQRAFSPPRVNHQAPEPLDDSSQWEEYTVETIADALLALPSSSFPNLPPNQLLNEKTNNTMDVKNIELQDQGFAGMEEEEYEEYTVAEELAKKNNGILMSALGADGDMDADDLWDDYTVATVADAFVTLPSQIQLEFLRNTTSSATAARTSDQWVDQSSQDEEDDGSGSYEMNPSRDQEVWYDTVDNSASPNRDTADKNQRQCQSRDSQKTRSTISCTDSSVRSDQFHDARRHPNSTPSSPLSSSNGLEKKAPADRSSRRSRSPRQSTLLDLLQRDIFSSDPSVVEASIHGLIQKCDEDYEYRSYTVQSGGILSIVRAMESNIEHKGIQTAACRALERIACDEEHQMAICDVGGVEAVLGAMTTHAADPAVVEAACCALLKETSSCGKNEMPIEIAAVEVIVSAMKRHSKHATIQEVAFCTLAQLCLESKERLTALSQIGGFIVMSGALVQHWEHTSVKNKAIQTLSQLFAKLAEFEETS